jgi:glycosyltransferase involved in cell wall biosynthesis
MGGDGSSEEAVRIGVYIGEFEPEIGGGFTFVDELTSALKRMPSDHEFFFLTQYGKGSATERTIPIAGSKLPSSLLGRIRTKVARNLPLELAQWLPLPSDEERLNRLIQEHRLELIYYPFPMFIRSRAPSVVTVWDLAHRIHPAFPEVSFDGWTWEEREALYRKSLPRAMAIITGTETGRRQIERHYGVHSANVHVIPLPTPSYILNTESADLEWPEKMGIKAPFLLYPAQFWPHKNHVNLLHALHLLRERGVRLDLVLTGSDKGNLSYVRNQAEELKLEDSVHFPGFVERSVLVTLYKTCAAMVFPSFFGPDNLPPLESMALGAPVLAADIDGARDQLKDAALYFEPTSPESIAQAIEALVTNKNIADSLRLKGKQLADSRRIEKYVHALNDLFTKLAAIRRCWPSG